MTEIRKHPFLDEYCIITQKRSERPNDFKSQQSACPFCPVTLDVDIIDEFTNQITVIKNRFPAVPNQEVIIESPDHNKLLCDFTDSEITDLIKCYQFRYNANNIDFVSIFRNYGKEAGASMTHPHSQVIPLNFIPPQYIRELNIIKNLDKCPYCDIVYSEINSDRFILKNSDWIVIAPYYSRIAYEMWILPQSHISNISEITNLESLGTILRDTLKKIDIVLGNPSYNFTISQMNDPSYHLSIHIEPHMTPAGFEKNTGIYINSVLPEVAAKELRSIKL